MIPLYDVIPSRRLPFLTVAILGLDVMAFVFELSLPESRLRQLVSSYGVVPARVDWAVVPVSLFLHAGWTHIAGNLIYVWLFGGSVEDRLGRFRFALFYLLCGSLATAVQAVSNPGSFVPIVGSSGAVAGILGAYFVLYPNSRILALVPLPCLWDAIEIPALFFLALWIVAQLMSGAGAITRAAAGNVANVALWGNVAAFAAGMALVHIFKGSETRWSD
ncbi:MAG: rhomboid family intramembrane serine protease [Vicinamibacterales bacterium]